MKATSEELAIFVSVVESGSFSRAAEQLGQALSLIHISGAASNQMGMG